MPPRKPPQNDNPTRPGGATLAEQEQVIGLLKGLNSLEPLKQLFWSDLNYKRFSLPLPRKALEAAGGLLVEDPLLFAAGGEGDAFHVIYGRLAEKGILPLGAERKIVEKLQHEHPYALYIFSDADQKRWHFLNVKYDPRESKRRLFRRITVGPEERLRTAAERIAMLDLGTISPSLFGIEALDVQLRHDDAFDVEKVTDAFFNEFKDIFKEVEALIKGIRGEDRKRLFTLRLFNRLMFIAFIEKKRGWLKFGEAGQYLDALWRDYRKRTPSGGNFYNERLRLLFFSGLSTPNEVNIIGINSGGFLKELIGEVKYLNGGLFDQNDDDKDERIAVPDEAVSKILNNLFARFNFTVTESTPLDIEVAVDPEMLGRVFENLITERGEKGSYYTPKPVVSFMCREVLKGYLGGYTRLIDQDNPAGIVVREASALLDKLLDVKIVDPACGSGAYLLGMLHELHRLHHHLDTLAHTDTPQGDYDRKLKIITKNIYGVDLDPFAVDIARLRLWLTLAVEFDGETPPPLPNLDFKIEVGDSLSCREPLQKGQAGFQQHLIEDFGRLKDEHVKEHHTAKVELNKKIRELRTRLAEWAYPGERVEDFDWAIDFAEVFTHGGFDIVLANPPYGASVEDDVRDLYFDKKTDGPQSKDTYGLFIARGLQLLKKDGHLSYIISDTWRTIRSHKPLRKRLATTTSVAHVLDLPAWIFKATVNTCILSLAKTAPAFDHLLVTGDLRPIPNYDWSLLEANLMAVAAHGPDVQTTEFARYTYRQTLIVTNENYPFFIASSTLFSRIFDGRLQQLGGENGIAGAHHGISTGDNKKYVRAEPGTRGAYPEITEAMKMSVKEMKALKATEKVEGVDKDWKKLKGCFVPFDKGGESDPESGWLPNYYVPTRYYINWAKGAIRDMKKNKGAAWKNEDYFFKPGITFSISGIYAPTFRLNSKAVFEAKGSCIFTHAMDLEVMLAILCSRIARYELKNFIKHTVDTSGDDVDAFRFPMPTAIQKDQLKTLVHAIIEKQMVDQRYPYHMHEQKEIDKLVYDLYGLSDADIREVELWFCRRYPPLAEPQGLMSEVKEKYKEHLARCELIMSKPPEYWQSSPILKLIAQGEGPGLEFKATLEADASTGEKHPGVLQSALKTIAAFLNTDGGTLLIGVADSGEIKGLDKDFQLCKKPDPDHFEQKLRDLLSTRFTPPPLGQVQVSFEQHPTGHVCRVDVKRSDSVVHLDKDVYVRDGNTTRKLEGPMLTSWIQERGKGKGKGKE